VERLSFVIISRRDDLRQGLLKTGHAEVNECLSDPSALHDSVRHCRPDVVFVDLSDDPTAPLDQFEKLAIPRPLLMISGPQEETGLMLRAMRLGAREFLPPDPSEADLKSAVERLLLDRPESPERARKPAPVVAVMGAKGGVGTTFVACQLAAELDRLGGQVVVVDLNLRIGDVALHFDLRPRYTLANLASEREELDAAYLDTILEPHSSGVHVLAAPDRAEEAELVGAHHLERAVKLLRARFDWVIVDVSRTWDETTVQFLDRADQIFLVTLMDVPTLSHARQHLELLQRLGNPADKIRLVANRYSKSAPVSDADFSEFLDRQPDALIPNDYPASARCVNEGKPLWQIAAKSSIRNGYRNLATRAHAWCGVELPAAGRPARFAFLRRFSRRSRHAAD
jgi:pilus assembly protein CpaE